MFKILLIALLAGGVFIYSKFVKPENKISLPQFPSTLSEVNLDTAKNWLSDAVSSQSAVLGQQAKEEGLNLIVDQAKKLSPEDFKSLQQFICE